PEHPVFYAGRYFEEVSGAGLPGDYTILSDWDVLPAQLGLALEPASILVVLDMLSFPFESLTGDLVDVPLILLPPQGSDADFLSTVFGKPAFSRLGFFDRVAVAEDDLWVEIQRRYGLAQGQRVEVEDGRPEHAASEIQEALEAESALYAPIGESDYEAKRYWSERGDALAGEAPHRAICSVNHSPKFNKAIHRVQEKALSPQIAVARGTQAEEVPFEVLEIGAGIGRWAASFDPAKTRFTGVDISEGMVETARKNFPQCRFDLIGDDPVLPYGDESFDLSFSVTVMHHNPTPTKWALISEMWRVTRPGGRLMFLEDFVSGGWSTRSTVYPMSVNEFVGLLLEATAGQVVLEHVESIRYGHDDFTRGGLLGVTKLGVARTW
ncbi:MAG TPA: class I SAM-dependent methyltransferase, partial [Rubrobacter sp.]|nr:class I SAM-dependent methyltransferase [Rubrobacter sp.]